MTLFLTSSPCIYNHNPATLNPANGFVARLRSRLAPLPRVLFVASSPDDHDKTAFYSAIMVESFERAALPFRHWEILDDETADQARELVAWADFIILMGGHVPTQNAFFQRIGLKRLLEGYPGVVMGISAGSMNSAEIAYAQPEADGESDEGFQRFYEGLGLTHIHICPHYQEVIEKEMEVDGVPIYPDLTAADSEGHTFHVFPDGTYLYRDEQEYAILGQCWTMTDGIFEKRTEDGERIEL